MKRPRRREYGKFTAQIEDIVKTVDGGFLAVMRASIYDVVDDAQTPTGKGGRMRVDTGFLRASGQASLTGMPTGPDRGDPNGKYEFQEASITASLQNMQLGNTFFFGWTAAYARYREVYDGFLQGALMHWDRIVTFHTDTVRYRIGSRLE
jgi:hypothetical protein